MKYSPNMKPYGFYFIKFEENVLHDQMFQSYVIQYLQSSESPTKCKVKVKQ